MIIDELGEGIIFSQTNHAKLFEPSGLVPFNEAWAAQQCCQKLLLQDPKADEAVWFLQHPECYTLGRGASNCHLHFTQENSPAPLYRIDRGGEVTYHAPGQLIAYPVLDLRRHKTDLHWYLRQLEEILIDVLAQLNLEGLQKNGYTGVWIKNKKVASIGVGCRRWICQHGLALNIDCDLSGFDKITPCGLMGSSVGRLSDWLPGLTVGHVQPLLRDAICERFALVWT